MVRWCAAGVALAVAAPAAFAGGPELLIQWSINGGPVNVGTPPGNDLGDESWAYDGAYTDPGTGLVLLYSFTGNSRGGLEGNVYLFNELLGPAEVVVDVSFALGVTGPATTELQGVGVAGLATGVGGGSLTSIEPWLWQTLFDGTPGDLTTSLFYHPFLMSISGPGAASALADFGFPHPVPAPPIQETIGVRIMYTVTSYDAASVTSEIHVVSCPGDVDDDGSVGTNDLVMLLTSWGDCPPRDCDADFDGDGAVGTQDLLILLESWGVCPQL